MGSVEKTLEKKRQKENYNLKRYSDIFFPTSIFRDTPLSAFESVVDYLKTDKGMSFREIGLFLDRDERNIWTVYNRAQKKK